MSDDRSIIVECARRRVASLLEAFCTDPRSRNGGGIVNAATGYADSRGSIYGLYYEERSPNYNMVANWGLLLLSDHWGRRELLELMARNLRFSLCMRQPCGEAETLFSHRQDRGGAGAAWGDYYLFKRMAVETGDGQFAQAADELLAGAGKKGPGSAFIPLIYMFDDERLARERVPRQPLPDRFEIRFRDTPIWRWRRGAVAATVVADEGGHWFDITQGTWGGSVRSDAVVSYHVEDAIVDAIKIRWGSGTGGFRPETIEYPAPGRLKLWYQDPGWDHVAHYRPRAKWGPRRIETNQCATMELDVDDDGGIGVIVNIGGWTDMMVNVQFLLRENGRLTGPDGKVTALQPGGRTFTACAGAYELAGPAGGRLRICGLPESEARCGIGDSRTITGLAETRCHRLIVCCFTPVRLSFRLEPAR